MAVITSGMVTLFAARHFARRCPLGISLHRRFVSTVNVDFMTSIEYSLRGFRRPVPFAYYPLTSPLQICGCQFRPTCKPWPALPLSRGTISPASRFRDMNATHLLYR